MKTQPDQHSNHPQEVANLHESVMKLRGSRFIDLEYTVARLPDLRQRRDRDDNDRSPCDVSVHCERFPTLWEEDACYSPFMDLLSHQHSFQEMLPLTPE